MFLYLLWCIVLALVVSWSGLSLSLLVSPLLGCQASLVLVTPPLLLGSLISLVLLTPSLVCEGSLASGLLAGDNSRLWGELATASAVGDSCSSESELVGDSSSLMGRGMNTLLSVLTSGLMWRQLKAASL